MTIDNINLHSYPGSEKTYMHGEIHPDVKVGMRRVILTPTVSEAPDGTKTVRENEPRSTSTTQAAFIPIRM